MDSDIFKTDTIYLKLRDEYRSSKWFNEGYKKFIDFKNLGIECIDINVGGELLDIYKIVDDKKWMFNKIKYGL